jgi:septal ring factor EnvC (AmiA/AmiB activator)
VDHLGKYAVTQERLDRFELLCQEFSDLIGRPRAIILQRKSANRSLTELFQEADLQLSRMDRLCPSLEETHPEFVAGYREHRSIVHVNATRPLSDEELENAVREVEEKQEAEARKAAAKASQEAEEAQRAAVREQMEEKLRVAKKGLPVPAGGAASSAESDVAGQVGGDRETTAAPAVNFGLPS